MLLYYIVSIILSNQTFTIVLCFIQNKQIESYKQVLETFIDLLSIPLTYKPILVTDQDLALLGTINSLWGVDYPDLLYIQHINKAILAKAKQLISNANFDQFIKQQNNLIKSPTKDKYKLNLIKLFQLANPQLIIYLKDIQLTSYYQKFIYTQTKNHLYLSNTTSLRTKGAYTTIKRYIGNSSSDLFSSQRSIYIAIKEQYNQIDLVLQEDRIKQLNLASDWLYIYLNKRIS